MEEQNNESIWTKVKGFVSRNKKKVIIVGATIGTAILGAGILGKHLGGNDDYIECVEDDYDSVEYVEEADDDSSDSEE